MKQCCKFHPTRPAHWHCPDCDDYFCPDCVETKGVGPFKSRTARLCTKCDSEVEWVGVANLIEPFWQRLPKIFLYALSPWPLALNLLICAGLSLFSPLPLIGFFISLFLYAILLKYSFSALRATGRGTLVAPRISSETATGDLGVVFKQFVLYILLIIANAWVGKNFGAFAGILFFIAALFYVPAMIIMLAASDSLGAALNPLRFAPLARRIGLGYLVMVVFLALLAGAPAALWYSILQHLPGGVRELLRLFATNYYTIVMYHLMGYVILQYHEQIGYQVDYDDFQDAGQKKGGGAATPEQRLLGRVDAMIKEGDIDDAIDLIRSRTRYDAITSAALAERYFDLLVLKKRKDILDSQGPELLKLFIKEKRKQKACEVYGAITAIDPSFLPEAADLHRVAGWLAETGKHREAVTAYNRVIKGYPGHELIVRAYFSAAQLFAERLKNPGKAREILTWLEKAHPRHELIPHVRSYRTKISS